MAKFYDRALRKKVLTACNSVLPVHFLSQGRQRIARCNGRAQNASGTKQRKKDPYGQQKTNSEIQRNAACKASHQHSDPQIANHFYVALDSLFRLTRLKISTRMCPKLGMTERNH